MIALSWLARRLASATEMARQQSAASLEALAVAGMRAAIETSTAPDGTPYPPLKRPRPDGTTKPLKHTGLLEASLSARYVNGELILYSDHPAAKFQNFGTRTIPARRFLGIPSLGAAARMTASLARSWAVTIVSHLRGV